MATWFVVMPAEAEAVAPLAMAAPEENIETPLAQDGMILETASVAAEAAALHAVGITAQRIHTMDMAAMAISALSGSIDWTN